MGDDGHSLTLQIPGTELNIVAHVLDGTDVAIVIKSDNGSCLGRIVIEKLCGRDDYATLRVGDHWLTPEPRK